MTEPEQHNDRTETILVLKPGTKLTHYTIEKKLGVGGMGEVYLAMDEKLHRKIALKFLPAHMTINKQFKDRFLREARSAAALNHPNIITIYEASEYQGNAYISMEFVSGKTLRELMDTHALDYSYTLDLVIQICDGLSAAHSAKVIHRDIKPLNILVDDNKRVRILDFGLAKAEYDDNLTQDGTAMGTVKYMSPEQGTGGEIDKRSDIFSAGILFYEMFSGVLPFLGPNMPATLHAIVNAEPKPLREHNEQIPEQLEKIILKMLHKNPDSRYQNIIDVKNEIINIKYGANIDDSILITQNYQIKRQEVKPEVSIVNINVKSIAVLYLRNISGPENEYLSYGITEDLIVDLTRVKSIKISPLRSIMKYKDSDLEFEEIAENLNVRYIVDGSIYKSDSSIKLSIHMYDAVTKENLWADRWEEPLENLPRIKNDLATEISKNLGVGVKETEDAEIGVNIAKDANAYDKYLQGKYLFECRVDKTDIEKAITFYNDAINQDSSLLIARIGLAEVDIHLGKFKDAKSELDSAYSKAIDNQQEKNQIQILKLYSRLYQKQSEWQQAMTYATKALSLTKSSNDSKGEIEILSIIISILQPQSKYEDALIHFERVLELSRQINDQEITAEALKNMGIIFSRKGEYDTALELYEEASQLAAKNKNIVLESACQANIGNIYYFKGDLKKAHHQYTKVLAVGERLGDTSIIARQNLNLGLIELMQSEYHKGLEKLINSSHAFHKLNDRTNYALALVNISQARLVIGETEKAEEAAQQALSIAKEIGQPLAETDALVRLSAVGIENNDLETALANLIQARELAESTSNNRNLALIELMIARAYFRKKDYATCSAHAKKALDVAKSIGEKNIIYHAEAFIGAYNVTKGLYNMGVKKIEDAIDNLEKINNIESLLIVNNLYAFILIKFGNSEDARTKGIQILEQTLEKAEKRKMILISRFVHKLLAKFRDNSN